MDSLFFIEEQLNSRFDRWAEAWNQPSGNQSRQQAVKFLQEWRHVDGNWFEQVAKQFLSLSHQLGYRNYNWDEKFTGEIQKLHFANHTIWHFEDEARRNDLAPETIVELKRGIDAVNQVRNNQMERLDEWILSRVNVSQDTDIPLHTETPGLILDRLSIMGLKQFHYDSQSRPEEVQILKEQRSDLQQALHQLVDDLNQGIRRVKRYKQLKTYNDPETNPAL